MAMSSNEKRAFWRKKCRKALADHIKEKVGVVIAPDKVRLQPGHEDPYSWVVTDSVKDLFQSNLGSGSVGVFQQICTALECGDMIEAIPRGRGQQAKPVPENHTDEACSASSFTATIKRLEREKEELQLQYTQYRQHKEQEMRESQEQWSEDSEKLSQELAQLKTQFEARSTELYDAKEKVASVVVKIERQLCHIRTALGIEVPYGPTSPSWSI